jgi:hypothetical protein
MDHKMVVRKEEAWPDRATFEPWKQERMKGPVLRDVIREPCDTKGRPEKEASPLLKHCLEIPSCEDH